MSRGCCGRRPRSSSGAAVADLRTRIELRKLAGLLDVDEAELAYLDASSVEDLRALRRVTADALFGRLEARVKLLASFSGRLPASVTAKIAQAAMGPALSARVAGVLEPATAARLAVSLSPEFLTDLATELDPSRVAPIVALLPDEVVLDVARRLIAAGRLDVVAGFVPIVDPTVIDRVAAETDAEDLLHIALYAEDDAAVDAFATRLDDGQLAALLRAAADSGEYDTATVVLGELSPANRDRLLAQAHTLDDDQRAALERAIAEAPPA